jgi:hypothetical protein
MKEAPRGHTKDAQIDNPFFDHRWTIAGLVPQLAGPWDHQGDPELHSQIGD